MYTYGQVFLNHGATGRTALRRATRINLTTHRTSIFRYVLCVRDQLTPCGIGNTFRQAMILDHPCDRQVLKDNYAKLGHNAAAQFVREVLAPIRDAFVNPAHNALVILAFRRAVGVLAHTPLGACKRLFIRTKEARICNALARREGRKLLQANINANGGAGMFGRVWLPKIARHDQIPVIRTAREGHGFDRPFNRAVHHDSDVPDVLEVHPILGQLGAVTKDKINGIEAISPLEARIPCCFPTLDTPEKGLEGFVQAPQGLLATGEIGLSKIRIGGAIHFQLCRLIAVAHASLFLFPCVFAFGKRTIVQMPMCIKHLQHRPRLLARGIQAVAKRFSHVFTVRDACDIHRHR